jgi:hypothetical protein
LQLKNLLEFRSDLFFEGAVQADWFYSKERADLVADSFVFHGPKYFGVTTEDVSDSRLIDTASFLEKVYNNLYLTTEETNPFMLTIAGYGTGKSHLAITLAKYFSKLEEDENIVNKISSNLKLADKEISKRVDITNKKKNFVIVLNGMRDFNLNYEILKAAKTSLKFHNYSEKFLHGISKAHEVAIGFIERNFERSQESFLVKSKKLDLCFDKLEDLKEKLIYNIHDEPVFDVVDSIYEDINGHKIRWDEGISANKILEKIEEELCGARGEFNKILIIFDEFGRFLEYASDAPQKAGDSALQQIFEAVQNADKNIMFLGTIQSDLKSYLTRVDKTSNISRYIGRFDVSDKVYLSSNLETIFANLIEKKDERAFESYVGQKLDGSEKAYHMEMHSDLKKWIPELDSKGVWTNWEKYKQVILKGVYPFHPVSTWLLSSLSNWLQNRSSLTLINRKIKENNLMELNEFGSLPFISPISLIEGELFSEMLSAEEEGRQRSQYCIIYNNILKKYGDKLQKAEKDTLTANLILRICKFKTLSRDDASKALILLSGLDEINYFNSLEILEKEYGVLQYDEISNCFDFIGDALGQADFRRFFRKKRENTKLNFEILNQLSVSLEELGGFSEIDTNFGKTFDVNSNEWKYKEEVLMADLIDERHFINFKDNFEKSTQPEHPKGKLLWLYINKDSSDLSISNIIKYSKNHLKDIPIVTMIINDKENLLFEAIKDLVTVNNLKGTERNEYAQFITEFEEKVKDRIKNIFYKLKLEKNIISNDGIDTIPSRISRYLDQKFEEIYPKIISFPFDGFSNKQLSRPKKMFLEISQKILFSNGREIDIRTAGVDVRNRFQSVLINSWKCVDENTLKLVHPKNIRVSNAYKFIDREIDLSNEKLKIKDIFSKLTKSPFGLNDYSATLLLFSYIANREFEIRLKLDEHFYNVSNWSEKLVLSNGKDLDFKKLESTELNIIDSKEENTKVRKILNEIKSNSDIERTNYLKEELNKSLSIANIEGDLADLIEIGKIQLEIGLELLGNYKRKIASYRYSFEDACNDDYTSVEKLIYLVKNIKKIDKQIDINYHYTEEQFSKFLEIEFSSKQLIKEKFEKWIEKVNCREVGKLNSFEKNMKSLGRELYELGYVDYQQKLTSKVESIVKNIENIRIYQHLREFIDNFIKECVLSSYTKYIDLKTFEEKGNEYINIIQVNNELLEEDKSELRKVINTKLKEISKYVKIIETEMTVIYDLLEEANTIEDLDYALSKISLLKTRGLDDNILEEFNYIGDFIMNFRNELKPLEEEMDRKIILEKQNLLSNNSSDDEYGIEMSNVLENFTDELLIKLDKKSDIWKINFLEIDIKKLTNQELKRWLNETELLPKYLLGDVIKKYKLIRDKVLEKLSEDKVKYIISLIDDLAVSEKDKIRQYVVQK